MVADPIRLFVYAGKDASFSLYEDEGINYNYEKNLYAWIPVSYDEETHKITIGERQGEFPGMLKTRSFEVVLINQEKPKGLDFSVKPDAVISYTGSEVFITIPVVKVEQKTE